MATIANLNVKLSANILGFVTGMRSALKPLASFGNGISKAASSLTSFAGLAGGALTVGALAVFVKHQMDAIDTTAKLSDRLGISTEALAGLQHAASLAGVSSEGLTGGLQKMLVALSTAATAGGPAADALGAMGLSAKSLADAAPDEAFKQIADGLLGIKNPADRAKAAVAIFGKSGQELLPLMLSGAEGIKAAQVEATKLGLTFSRLDAAKVEAANDAMTKLGSAFAGAGNALAIQLAPFITAAADKLVEMGTSGEGMAAKIINSFEWILTAIAKTADYLNLIPAAFYAIQGSTAIVLGGLVQMLGGVIQAVEWLIEKCGGVTGGIGEMTRAVGKEMVVGAVESFRKAGESYDTFAKGANGAAVTATFDDIRAKAEASAKAIAANAAALNGGKALSIVDPEEEKRIASIGKAMEGLTTDLATFGMGSGEKKLFDLKALGADPAQLDQAKKLIDSLDVKQTAADIGKAMDTIRTDLATAGMSDIDKKLFDMSNLGATSEQLAEAKKMLEQIDATTNKPDTTASKGPELMLSGSAEAQKLAYMASIGVKMTGNDAQARQLKEQQNGNTFLDRIEQNTRGAAGLPAYA